MFDASVLMPPIPTIFIADNQKPACIQTGYDSFFIRAVMPDTPPSYHRAPRAQAMH